MKMNTVLIAVALLAYWAGLCNASAFYDPSMQRWLNRDPLGEPGFQIITSRHTSLLELGALLNQNLGKNLYEFVLNSPADRVDIFGLNVWDGPTGPGTPACSQALQAMEQAEAAFKSDPSVGNMLLYQMAIANVAWACKPPPPPLLPPIPDPCPTGPFLPTPSPKKACFWVTVGVVTYWVCSEGSRIVFPPRNLVPVP
jgi:hypothetical protein